jgi:hypothetical protein
MSSGGEFEEQDVVSDVSLYLDGSTPIRYTLRCELLSRPDSSIICTVRPQHLGDPPYFFQPPATTQPNSITSHHTAQPASRIPYPAQSTHRILPAQPSHLVVAFSPLDPFPIPISPPHPGTKPDSRLDKRDGRAVEADEAAAGGDVSHSGGSLQVVSEWFGQPSSPPLQAQAQILLSHLPRDIVYVMELRPTFFLPKH